MKKLFLLLAVASLCLTSVCAQSKMSNWTRVILDQKKQMNSEMLLNNQFAKIRMDNGSEVVDCYVHFKGEIDVAILEQYGAKLLSTYEGVNIVTAAVPVIALEALSENEQVEYVKVAMPADIKLDKARQTGFVDRAHYGFDKLTTPFKGNGVIVGVVDQELQYFHPAFWNESHTRYRIKKVWNEDKYGNPPAGFYYGWEYTDSADIKNAVCDISPSKAESGHATHVMGIAAGADHSLGYYGVAQEADIVYVACPGTSSSNIPDGIKYVFQKATEMGKPCVVNVSMGGWEGPHDGTSSESMILKNLSDTGRIVCASAGNEGYSKIHCALSFSAKDTIRKTSYKSVTSTDGNNYCYADLWGDTNLTYVVRAIVYDKDSLKNVWESDWCKALPEGNDHTVNINAKMSVRSSNDLYVYGSLVGSKYIYNNRGNVSASLVLFKIPDNCVFGLEVKSLNGGSVNLFTTEQLGTFSSSGAKKYGFVDGDYNMTVCEPSGVTDKILSVGAYVSNNKDGGTFGDRAYFSSKGPTLDGRVKPDIAGPGMVLMSAYPDFEPIKSGRAKSVAVGGTTYYYGYMQGTSMSSPFVAGVVALWLEADPTLDYDGIIDVFQHSCIIDNYTGSVPNNSWGWGKIDAYYGLLYILGYTQGIEDVTKPFVLGVYEVDNTDVFKVGFAKNVDDLTVRVYDMSGRLVYTGADEYALAGQEITVDLSNMAPGIYVINVAGENYKVVR